MSAVVAAEAIAIALLAVLVLGLLRSHALVLRALDELGAGLDLEREAAAAPADAEHTHVGPPATDPPGPVPVELGPGVVPASRPARPAPRDVVGTDLDGREVTVELDAAGPGTLLAFLSSGCSVCQTFWEEFAAGDVAVPGGARLLVLTQGPQEDSRATLRRLAGPDLTVVQSSSAWSDLQIPGSPYFVHVQAGAITGEGSSTTWEQVAGLMGQGVADIADARAARGAPEVGRGVRDDLPRMDAELIAAGIHPGHGSLYADPDASDGATEAAQERSR